MNVVLSSLDKFFSNEKHSLKKECISSLEKIPEIKFPSLSAGTITFDISNSIFFSEYFFLNLEKFFSLNKKDSIASLPCVVVKQKILSIFVFLSIIKEDNADKSKQGFKPTTANNIFFFITHS